MPVFFHNSTMNKSQLRKQITDIINNLKAGSRLEQSEAIFQKLIKHERYLAAGRLSIYLNTEREIDTKRILQHALEVAGKQCYIPFVRRHPEKCHSTATRMIMVRLSSMSEYEELPVNHYGIKEPVIVVEDEKVADPSNMDLDLVIVPGVAFSVNGHRLGHGKGYYDEFLTNWQQKTSRPMYTIGLAFREQIVDSVPTIESHDFILNEVLYS